MAKTVKASAVIKSCSTPLPISHDHCSIVGKDVASNPIPSTVFNRSRSRSNYLFS